MFTLTVSTSTLAIRHELQPYRVVRTDTGGPSVANWTNSYTSAADFYDDQSWFWTEQWQQEEREATEDIENGRLSPKLSTPEEIERYLYSPEMPGE